MYYAGYNQSQPGCGGGNTLTENLILDSGVEYTNELYAIHTWDLSEKIELNTVYTITLWGELAENKTCFAAYPGEVGNDGFGTLNEIGDGVYSLTFTKEHWLSNVGDISKVEIFAIAKDQSGTSTVHRIKLEKGKNYNPVWTPAPQDITSLYKRVAALEQKA